MGAWRFGVYCGVFIYLFSDRLMGLGGLGGNTWVRIDADSRLGGS